MIINLSTINFDETGSGGGGTPARLQFRTVGIIANGMRNIMPNGYDGMAELTINTAISGETSAIDFYPIGYDYDLNEQLNSVWNNSINHSKSLLDAWNPSNTSASKLYKGDTNLIYAPNIDTSNVTSMYQIFDGCSSLTTVPLLDTSNVTTMQATFASCPNLTTIPLLDTSKVTNMYNMFLNDSSLITIPAIDTSNVTNIGGMFAKCNNLESLPLLNFGSVTTYSYVFGYSNITTLTTLGGFKDLKINWTSGGLSLLPNLTYQSVMNVINNLYDFRTNGDTTTTRTLKLNANSLALLSDDDKAIATAKGWVLS